MKSVLSILLWLAIPFYSMAQQAFKEIIPPSPNAAAIAKYGNLPVSTYTGVPEISIPLYQIQVRDITVPISINYHASGIKVSEEASRVGLGWSLNCGGVISRNVVNKDDFLESPTGYLSNTNSSPLLPQGPSHFPPKYLVPGVVFPFFNIIGQPTTNVNLEDYIYGSDNDYEPDQFNFNFASYSGKFILTPKRGTTIPREVILEKQSKIKIVPADNGSSWEVTTSDGFKYSFNEFEQVDNQVKSSWYLTKINSPQGEEVTFEYKLIENQGIRPVGLYNETVEANVLPCSGFNCTSFGNTQAPATRKNYTINYLSAVKWKLGKIEFEMEEREDLEGDNRVKSMKIYRKIKESVPESPDDYQFIEQQVFSYSYFDYIVASSTFSLPDVSPERLRKRLKLTAITKQSANGTGEKEKHSFTYYEEEANRLPPKNSFARDHWGYANEGYASSLIPTHTTVSEAGSYVKDMAGVLVGTERNPSPTRMKAFSLKEITYPTKGKSVFYYGVNDYELIEGTDQTEYYKPTTQPLLYDAAANLNNEVIKILDLTGEYVSASGKTIPVDVSVSFRANDACLITGNPIAYFELIGDTDGLTYQTVSFGGVRCTTPGQLNCLSCSNPGQGGMGVWNYKSSILLPPGKYKWKAKAEGASVIFQDIQATYNWYADAAKLFPLGPTKKYALAGGLRVERIEDYEPETNKVYNVRTFNYHHTDMYGIEHSYGKRMRKPSYTYFDIAWEKDVSNGALSGDLCFECTHVMRQSDSYLPVTGSLGNAVGYSTVIETHGETGQNGSISYEYENDWDMPWPITYPYGPGGTSDPKGYWLRPAFISANTNPLNGKLKSSTTFNAAGLPITNTTNVYYTKYGRTIYGLEKKSVSTIALANADVMIAGSVFGVPRAEVLMNVYPAMQSRFEYLGISIQKHYDQNGILKLTSSTNYNYDNQDHLQLTKSTTEKSDNNLIVTKYKYPADYTDTQAGTVVASMKNNFFMHAVPIETTQSEQIGEVEKITGRSVSVYGSYNGKVLPAESIALSNSSAIPSASLPDFVPANPVDWNTYRSLYTLDYDADNNLKRMTKASDAPVTYLWGYNKKLPIAKVTNASPGQSYHTSFEEDGVDFIVSGLNQSKSGSKVKVSSSFTFPVEYTPVIAQTLMSYWYWQNNKWNFSGIIPYQATITTTGTQLDEIRAFPKGAQMSTFTHLPLVGMLTQTDVNNITTYYEYDLLGQLKLVRDNNKKIVKSYEYGYKK